VFRKRADRIVHQLIEDMSYNTCGFITNQKLSDKLEELSEALSVDIQSSEESTLEEALEDKDEYADIDVYEEGEASLVFCSNALLEEDSKLGQLTSGGKQLTEFMLSETSMVFAFRFYEQGEKVAEDFYVFEPGFTCYGANKLQLTEASDILEEGLSAILQPLMGKPFEDLDLSASVLRLKL
tara:strand:- start:36836 stop:37381 length:546 start_codon:yes stop_codon:yes gene_type:complete